MQEFKEERKQNVRFADIVTKPINIHFSKSDSDEDSNTNVSDPLSIAIPINSIVMRNSKRKLKLWANFIFKQYVIPSFFLNVMNPILYVHTITTILSC